MNLKNFLAGIEIFRKYYDSPDAYQLAAEHDTIYLYSTNKPLSPEDLETVLKLGWGQEESNVTSKSTELYNSEEGWYCYV